MTDTNYNANLVGENFSLSSSKIVPKIKRYTITSLDDGENTKFIDEIVYRTSKRESFTDGTIGFDDSSKYQFNANEIELVNSKAGLKKISGLFPINDFKKLTVLNVAINRSIFNNLTSFTFTETLNGQEIRYLFIIDDVVHYKWNFEWVVTTSGDIENGNTSADLALADWSELQTIFNNSKIKTIKILVGFKTTNDTATPLLDSINMLYDGFTILEPSDIKTEIIDSPNGTLSTIKNISGSTISNISVYTLNLR